MTAYHPRESHMGIQVIIKMPWMALALWCGISIFATFADWYLGSFTVIKIQCLSFVMELCYYLNSCLPFMTELCNHFLLIIHESEFSYEKSMLTVFADLYFQLNYKSLHASKNSVVYLSWGSFCHLSPCLPFTWRLCNHFNSCIQFIRGLCFHWNSMRIQVTA